jgi:hypothetical protein
MLNKDILDSLGEADGFQLLYAIPLTTTQMNALGMDTLHCWC